MKQWAKVLSKKVVPTFLSLVIGIISITKVSAQHGKPVADIDFVQIKNDNKAEAMFFYENNWKVFRQVALEKGYIKSYKLLTTSADSVADFHIILFTEYKDSIQYKAREDNFRLIMNEISPNGSKLLNKLLPENFRMVLFSKKTIAEFGN